MPSDEFRELETKRLSAPQGGIDSVNQRLMYGRRHEDHGLVYDREEMHPRMIQRGSYEVLKREG